MINKLNKNKGIKKIMVLVNELRKTKPVIIGISGGSGSGKGYISKIISKKLKGKTLSMDNYYLGLKKIKNMNFDTPDALDLKLLEKHIKLLKKNKIIKNPVYNFKTHKRIGYTDFKPSEIIILEGLFAFYGNLKNEIDIKVFIDAPEKVRFTRRLKRDTKERGRSKSSVINQWKNTAEPMYKKYVKPQKKYADIIITNN